MSAAGGPHLALLEAQRRGCDTVQLFTKAPSQWAGKPLDPAQIQLFRQTLRQTKLKYPTAHDGYLINLASPDESLYRRSLEAFLDEMRRAEALGLRYLVTHPGAHLDDTEANGIARIARAIDTIHEQCRDFKVQILLETTAGQGTTLDIASSISRIFSPGCAIQRALACASIPVMSSRPATNCFRRRRTEPRCATSTSWWV